jgi:hypothetical protein
MNKRSIAEITIAGDGVAVWTPSPKIAALGFAPTLLGKPTNPFPFENGQDPNEYCFYADDCPVKHQIMALNSASRAQYRTARVARRVAKKLADARSPDR